MFRNQVSCLHREGNSALATSSAFTMLSPVHPGSRKCLAGDQRNEKSEASSASWLEQWRELAFIEFYNMPVYIKNFYFGGGVCFETGPHIVQADFELTV